MNRAFYIIFAPAIIVAAFFTAMSYGRVLPRWVGFAAMALGTVAAIALAVRSRSTRAPKQAP